MKLISVIIPAYNAEAFVGGAIDSVLTQTMQDFEIVVIDDGSTDRTASVVKRYQHDPRVRYVYQANHGLPHARNAGALIASGEYLAFLDSDDLFASTALEMMYLRTLASNASWCLTAILKIDGDTRTVRRPNIPSGDLLNGILRVDFVTRAPFYLKKDFLEIGMHDEEMRVREDWDLHIRMISSGKPFVYVDDPLYIYVRTEGSITTGNLSRLYSFTEKLLRKHHKRLADCGNRDAARIYAKNMWGLGRRYFYELGNTRHALRCAYESLRYDMNFGRLVHPLNHRIGVSLKLDRPG